MYPSVLGNGNRQSLAEQGSKRNCESEIDSEGAGLKPANKKAMIIRISNVGNHGSVQPT